VTPEERFELLGAADAARLETIADAVLAAGVPVAVLSGPEVVTAPIRLRVPGADATAVIGHVALTSCTVEVDGVRGDGCRPGRDLQGALAAAICDAEAERTGPLAAQVGVLLVETDDDRVRRLAGLAAVVETTRTDRTP
jgi:alpha-D-ribose 1-methylphosphonate 5-triphosphate synthase subunit PhnG